MPKKNTRYTKMPCGLRLRLNVESGHFDLVGDLGGGASGTTLNLPKHMSLNIVASPKNLMALSAFFLARAREAQLCCDTVRATILANND